jgi:hypothetical protein
MKQLTVCPKRFNPFCTLDPGTEVLIFSVIFVRDILFASLRRVTFKFTLDAVAGYGILSFSSGLEPSL